MESKIEGPNKAKDEDYWEWKMITKNHGDRW